MEESHKAIILHNSLSKYRAMPYLRRWLGKVRLATVVDLRLWLIERTTALLVELS